MEDFARYLVDFSDLYADREPVEGPPPAEWEEELEDQFPEGWDETDWPALMDLGDRDLSALEPGHLREFLGWFLPKEGASADEILECAEVLRRWLEHLQKRGWRREEELLAFREAIDEVAPEAARAARASLILHDWARAGGGMPKELAGSRFEDFAEGHARLVNIIGDQGWFSFEDEYGDVGPVRLPSEAIAYLRVGDVIDAEFGLRGGRWWLVDSGAVYPGCVYVDVGEWDGRDKTF
ncbi:MAG: hypothetical protein D6771_06485 [Zetaproteobacteria bacterium]|nr:MAG: hypothetical protein D6771_06485 [Zetaproteobacteria bacterium]